MLSRRSAEQEGGEDRDQRESQRECADHRQRDGDRHRPKELALDPLEGQDRHVDRHDDQDAEGERPRDLHGRVLHLANDLVSPHPALAEVPHDVFRHDHGAIHDDPEVDGAQGQQVGGNAAQIHDHEGEQERERDDDGHDERGPHVVEEEREQDGHQQGALDEISHDGGHRRRHEVVSAVVRADRHPGRKQGADLVELLLDAGEHGARILALPHEHDTLHEIVLVVAAQHPEADGVADRHLPDVTDPDRGTLLRGGHDVLEVAQALDQADASHHEGVLAVADVAPARVGVVGAHGVEDLLEREVVRPKPRGLDRDLVLFDAAAPGDDVHDPGHAAELPLEHPILKRLQLDQRCLPGMERVAVHLADHAGQRPQLRPGVGRDSGLGDAFQHLLACPVIVGAIGEEDPNVREAEVREGAQKRHVGDTVKLLLELQGDVALDLLGGVARPERDDVDLHIGNVGIRLDRQARKGDDPGRRQDQHYRQGDEPLLQRERDDTGEHVRTAPSPRPAKRRTAGRAHLSGMARAAATALSYVATTRVRRGAGRDWRRQAAR